MSDTSDTGDELYTDGITQKAILFGPDDRILLTRADEQWSVPGGKFEYGETIHGGLRRELREELSVTARIGAPVDTVYGAWLDDTGTPLVTTFHRAVTDDPTVELNAEHDDSEWVSPATARERLAEAFGRRLERALARARHPRTELVPSAVSPAERVVTRVVGVRERDAAHLEPRAAVV